MTEFLENIKTLLSSKQEDSIQIGLNLFTTIKQYDNNELYNFIIANANIIEHKMSEETLEEILTIIYNVTLHKEKTLIENSLTC